MGLLSDPKQRQKIISAITKYNQILCIVLYIGGLGGFLALAYEPFNAGIYFSENALLPGLVENEFFADFDVKRFNNELTEEMKKSEKERSLPKEWLFQRFQELGLETYYHNFTLNYPFSRPTDRPIPGKNIYAILRAKRTASTEAVVMSVPLRHPAVMPNEQTSGGIAVMLALAKHFRRQTYWAKDIIFVLTEFDEIGMQAWLDGYHQTQSEYIKTENFPGRSGQIQAAINLEIPADNVQSFNLKVEGLNGQLPNLDLVNLAIRLCHKERAKVTLNKQADLYDAETLEGYKRSLVTMLYMMWNQASGSPTGNHGLFHRYHIEALTIQGVQEVGGRRSHGVESTTRLVEGVFRSLNNLLEKFHQSFFFYILPSTSRYISIGLYMPPFGAMIAAGLIKAIALWIGAGNKTPDTTTSDKKKPKTDNDDKDDDAREGGTEEQEGNTNKNPEAEDVKDGLSEDEEEEYGSDEDKPIGGIVSVIPVLFISMLMALLAYTGPKLLTNAAPPFRLRPEDSLMFGLLALFCAAVAYPKLFNKKKPDEAVLQLDWTLLKCIALIVQSLTLFSIALMNISLAFFIGAVMVPVTTFITPTKSTVFRWLQMLLLLLVSPLALVFFSGLITAWLDDYSSVGDLFNMTWGNMKHCVFMKLLDLYLFGNWTYTVMSFVVFPCWLFFWAIPSCNTSIDV